MTRKLDSTDWRILKELMADGSLTNVALAGRSDCPRLRACGGCGLWRRRG